MQKSLKYAESKLKKLKQETDYRKREATYNSAAIKNDAGKFQYLTGLPHPDVIDWIFSVIKDNKSYTCL